MVKVKEDMTGWKMWEHGIADSRLIVIEQVEDYIRKNGKRSAQWLCECVNCNKTIVVNSESLRAGHTKSCGCLQSERSRKANKKYNKYKLNLKDEHGLYGIGYCSNTGREFYFDMEDYDKIKDYCWKEQKSSNCDYSIPATALPNKDKDIEQKNKTIIIRLHYLISGKYSDHIDRNTFNNRKHNLRPATLQENARNVSISKNNKSGFIGVSWNKNRKKWESCISIDGRTVHLGLFKDKKDAIHTRLKAEAEHFKEFAPQRHLFEEYGIKV